MGNGNRYALLVEPHRFEIEEEPVPVPKENQILVQVRTGGMCRWEHNHWHGRLGSYPQRIGHEWSGTVVSTGAGIHDVAEGDNVTGLLTGLGGFAEYVLVDTGRYCKLDSNADPRYAIGEPLKCIVTIIRNTAPEPGDIGVVLGTGPMGLFCLQLLSGNLLSELVAIDLRSDRLELARQYGATVTIDASQTDPEEELARLTGGRMADFVIDGTGDPDTIRLSCAYLRKGRGKLVMMSAHEEPTPIPFDFRPIQDKGIIVIGSHPPSATNQMDDMRRATALYSKGTLQVKPLISHEFPLGEIQRAFEFYTQPDQTYLKGIIVP